MTDGTVVHVVTQDDFVVKVGKSRSLFRSGTNIVCLSSFHFFFPTSLGYVINSKPHLTFLLLFMYSTCDFSILICLDFTCVHTQICRHIYVYTHIYIHIHVYACIHIHKSQRETHAQKETYMHTHKDIYSVTVFNLLLVLDI